MCISWNKHFAAALLLLCLPLLVIGCGGGGGGGGGDTVLVSGVASKGVIAGGTVTVYRLLATGARGEVLGTGITAADGSYHVTIAEAAAAGPVVITVTGNPQASYLSETTGEAVPFTASESFSAVTFGTSPDLQVAVTPLTEAAYRKLPLILQQKPGADSLEKLGSSIVAANAQVGEMFHVSDILAPPGAGSSYQAALTVVDQMVEDSKEGGTITTTSAAMTVLNQAVASLDPELPAYQDFVEVFAAAAVEVQQDHPGAVAVIVEAITQAVTEPPAEPNYSDLTGPSTVTGLSAATFAINSTASSVVLSWNPSSDDTAVAGYDVYRDGSKIATVPAPGYTDQPVTSNVTYLYTVVAFDAAGNRAGASAALSVRPNQPTLNVIVNGQLSTDILGLPQNDVTAPSAPANLTAATVAISGSNSSVTLNWSAASDAVGVAGYEVFRNGVKLGTVATTGYFDPSVTSNVTVTYFVIAFDAAGNRSAASAALFVTPNQASLGVTVNGQVITGQP